MCLVVVGVVVVVIVCLFVCVCCFVLCMCIYFCLTLFDLAAFLVVVPSPLPPLYDVFFLFECLVFVVCCCCCCLSVRVFV